MWVRVLAFNYDSTNTSWKRTDCSIQYYEISVRKSIKKMKDLELINFLHSRILQKTFYSKHCTILKTFHKTISRGFLPPPSLRRKGFRCRPRWRTLWNQLTRGSSSDWLPSCRTSARPLRSPHSTTATVKKLQMSNITSMSVYHCNNYSIFNSTTHAKLQTPTPEGLGSLQLHGNSEKAAKEMSSNAC